jgi:hypothetical protein
MKPLTVTESEKGNNIPTRRAGGFEGLGLLGQIGKE